LATLELSRKAERGRLYFWRHCADELTIAIAICSHRGLSENITNGKRTPVCSGCQFKLGAQASMREQGNNQSFRADGCVQTVKKLRQLDILAQRSRHRSLPT
jgi:hypothetical protein